LLGGRIEAFTDLISENISEVVEILRDMGYKIEEPNERRSCRYKIVCYIPVEPEEPEIYDTYEEAEEAAEHLRQMHPENRYEIVEAEP